MTWHLHLRVRLECERSEHKYLPGTKFRASVAPEQGFSWAGPARSNWPGRPQETAGPWRGSPALALAGLRDLLLAEWGNDEPPELHLHVQEMVYR